MMVSRIKRLFISIYRFYIAVRGKLIFNQIKQGESDYYFLKFGHLGDVVRTLPAISMFRQYLYEQGIVMGRIIAIVPKNQAGLVKINPEISERIILSKKKIKYLKRFAESKFNHYQLYSDSYGPFHVSEAYGIPYDYVKKNLELFRISEKVNAQFENDALDFMSRREINPEKTLILVPYAGSSSSLPYGCLNRVVEHYKSFGFRVFTNVGLSEAPLQDTEPLSESANIVFGIISMGATVVGVQSGFMDSCEWLNLTNKRIKIFLTNTDSDIEYLRNYNYSIDRHIERRGSSVTVVVSNNIHRETLCDEVIELGLYYLKGTAQRKLMQSISNNKFEKIKSFTDFNEYFEQVCKMNNMVIIISSSGGKSLYKVFDSNNTMCIDRIEDKHNFLAVYDTDNGLIKTLSSDDLVHGLTYLGSISDNNTVDSDSENIKYPTDNWLYVLSNAKDRLGYSKSSIVINGEEYSPNQEGLNVVVYSKECCVVVDSFSVNCAENASKNIYRIKDND